MGLWVREEEFFIHFILLFAFIFFTKSMHGLSCFNLALLFFKEQMGDFRIFSDCILE